MALTRQSITELVRAWREAQLPEGLVEGLDEALERITDLAEQRKDLAAKDSTGSLISAVANGTVTLREAVVEHVALTASKQAMSASLPTARLTHFYRAAKNHVLATAEAELKNQRELIGETITKKITDIEAEAHKLRQGLEATSAQDAMRAGTKQAGIWTKLVALDDARAAVRRAHVLLVSNFVLAGDEMTSRRLARSLLPSARGKRQGGDAA